MFGSVGGWRGRRRIRGRGRHWCYFTFSVTGPGPSTERQRNKGGDAKRGRFLYFQVYSVFSMGKT